MRSVDEVEPLFLGRLPLAEIPELLRSIAEHQCFAGEDPTSVIYTQWLCYTDKITRKSWCGFEIAIGGTD